MDEGMTEIFVTIGRKPSAEFGFRVYVSRALELNQVLWIPDPWAMQRGRNPRCGSGLRRPLNRRSNHFESVRQADHVKHVVQRLSGLAKRGSWSLARLHEFKGGNQLRQNKAPSGTQATQDGRPSGVGDMGTIPGQQYLDAVKGDGARQYGPWLATRRRAAKIPPTPGFPGQPVTLKLAAMPPSVVALPRDRRC